MVQQGEGGGAILRGEGETCRDKVDKVTRELERTGGGELQGGRDAGDADAGEVDEGVAEQLGGAEVVGELEEHDPQGPDVGLRCVGLQADELGGDVVRGAADGGDRGGDVLCEAKVDELDAAAEGEHDVVGLQVAMHDVFLVEEGERLETAGGLSLIHISEPTRRS